MHAADKPAGLAADAHVSNHMKALKIFLIIVIVLWAIGLSYCNVGPMIEGKWAENSLVDWANDTEFPKEEGEIPNYGIILPLEEDAVVIRYRMGQVIHARGDYAIAKFKSGMILESRHHFCGNISAVKHVRKRINEGLEVSHELLKPKNKREMIKVLKTEYNFTEIK